MSDEMMSTVSIAPPKYHAPEKGQVCFRLVYHVDTDTFIFVDEDGFAVDAAINGYSLEYILPKPLYTLVERVRAHAHSRRNEIMMRNQKR